MNRKMLLVGWDAADWKVITPLLDAGLMPALNTLIENGCMGNISTLDPPLSPLLWTSIATGKRAYDHGILNFTEPDFENNYIKPVQGSSRKTKAFWNILSEQGFKTHVVGWWPSHPAEQINGICVSNLFQKSFTDNNGTLNLTNGCIYPKEYESLFSELVVEPWEITAQMIEPFIPDLKNVPKDNNALFSLAGILADASSVHAAATYILENHEWDCVAVYYDAIDHFSHRFMHYHPPKSEHVTEAEFNLYKNVLTVGYIFHDMMLGRLLELAGDDVTVMIVSDHGFHTEKQLPFALPKEPAAPAFEHRQHGIVVVSGNGIRKDDSIFGAGLLDITPTILNLFGLPCGKDMEGRVLQQAFTTYTPIPRIASWGNNVYSNLAESTTDPWANQIAMQQLIDLGYVESPEGGTSNYITVCVNDSQHFLAKSYIDGHKYPEAYAIIRPLYLNNKRIIRFGFTYIQCCDYLQLYKEAYEVIEELKKLDEASFVDFDLIEGDLLKNQYENRKAIEKFSAVLERNPQNSYASFCIALCYFRLGDDLVAMTYYLRALAADDSNPAYYHGLAQSYFNQGKFDECIAVALQALNLSFSLPKVHWLIAESFYNLGKLKEASGSYEWYLKMVPGNLRIRKKLADVYQKMEISQMSEVHMNLYNQSKSGDYITVVSGLPRSGTSMMMQLLCAGGLEAVTDNLRKADNHNPHGYYEYEQVKSLHKDASWVNTLIGKGPVKIVIPQLLYLPPGYNYKIIFMNRNLDEIVNSQQEMLSNGFAVASTHKTDQLKTVFGNFLTKCNAFCESPNIEVLNVHYKDFVSGNEAVIYSELSKIKKFLNADLEIESMYRVIDPGCYHSKV
ncbi:MAG TPA: alkaline phosphatase family protein [Bacteroidia bacterium]|nr:alkaline phosphatase family protein [Bacteroidia bacterium]